MFGSRTVTIHLIRGVLGLAFLAVALQYSSVLGWWTAVPALAALVCLGGCPMCWIVGLVGTILKDDPAPLCLNGSCAKPQSRDLEKY